MKKLFEYRFLVGAVSIAAGIFSLACLIVGVMAVKGHFEAFSDPALTLMYATQTALVKWFNLLSRGPCLRS